MKIRKSMPLLVVGLLALTVSNTALAIPSLAPSCADATFGTCAHFDYGDGQSPDITVESFVQDPASCRVTRPDTGVSCYFDSYNCSTNEGYIGDAHDQPAAVYCTGCGSSYEFSINEAKNCILYGRPN
jgi:hypothetical protein